MDPNKLDRIARRISGVAEEPKESVRRSSVRTAGTIEFKKDTGPLRRDVRSVDFKWDPEALKDLSKILWSIKNAHAYALSAYKSLSKMPSSHFSPDGLLGGRGYIQSIKELRASLSEASELLSSSSDTIHDEINADHWLTVIEDPGSSEIVDDVKDVMSDVKDTTSNPEEMVNENYDEVTRPEDESDFEFLSEPVQNPKAEDFNPTYSNEDGEEDSEAFGSGFSQQANAGGSRRPIPEKPKGSGSSLPTDTSEQKEAKSDAEAFMNTTTNDRGSYASSIDRILKAGVLVSKQASTFLPFGLDDIPRVDRRGPAEGAEDGTYNYDLYPSEDPLGEGNSSGVNDSQCLYESYQPQGVYQDPSDGDNFKL